MLYLRVGVCYQVLCLITFADSVVHHHCHPTVCQNFQLNGMKVEHNFTLEGFIK